ncbi:MAG: Solvent efflux pump outer membrane protein SrpC [Gammaproteobacteria bacterium]|nr:Solvent efflux pump outer membrane protein SrpC [Gammaproteobacteria bacterium]
MAISLSGCAAVGPDYHPPDAKVPPGWSRLDASALRVVQPAAAGDLSEWWRGLNDPLLAELVAEALRANPDLRSARARVREARARRAVAASARFPTVDAAGNASRTESSGETGSGESRDLFSAGFDASWELDVFGGVRRGVEAAEADLEASQADLQATRVSLAAEAASSYVEVRAQQALLGIARSNLATQSETLQLTEWRDQAGLVSSQDVAQARSNREQTRAQIPILETNLAVAEHDLESLLARPPGALHERLAGAGDLPAVPPQIAVGIPADTVRQRPDVRAAERELAAETARVGIAEAARYPSFSLSGSIGLEALALGALGNSEAVTSSVFAGITAPIFDADRLRSQVEIQDAVREQAYFAYQRAVLVALQDVENALVDLSRNRDRNAALANAVDAARSAAELARLRYGTGLIDFQSVLDSERNVLLLEESLARNRADGVLALISLYKALGGGWSTAESPAAAKDTP